MRAGQGGTSGGLDNSWSRGTEHTTTAPSSCALGKMMILPHARTSEVSEARACSSREGANGREGERGGGGGREEREMRLASQIFTTKA